LKCPLAVFFSFTAIGGGCGAIIVEVICGKNAVPFSDATIFAMVTEAAAAAARLDIGALAAAASASVAASSSGNPIAGVR
jgi:hypothetical protein